jgi:ribosomal protein S18 acetylase RimI-like enzyme
MDGAEELLDNPIWSALTTEHRLLALGDGLARRYPTEIGPLSGLLEPSAEALVALRTSTEIGGLAVLFLESPLKVHPGWSMVRDGAMQQMIWPEGTYPAPAELTAKVEMRQLKADDVPEMVALAHLTEPGPFGRRTAELGEFFGVFEGGRLLAMSGQRLHMSGFTEISAVCTHPDARGQGYARALVAQVTAAILRGGNRPMLHVFATNSGAIRVYEEVGFRLRRYLHLAAMKRVD